MYPAQGERADRIAAEGSHDWAQKEDKSSSNVDDSAVCESAVLMTEMKPRRASLMLTLAKDKVNELSEASAATDKTLADLEALMAGLQQAVAQMATSRPTASTARPTAEASGSSGPLRTVGCISKRRISLGAAEISCCMDSDPLVAQPTPSRSMRRGSIVSVGDMSMVSTGCSLWALPPILLFVIPGL